MADYILIERRKGRDSTLNRPEQLNANEPTAQRRAAAAVERMNADDDVGCLGCGRNPSARMAHVTSGGEVRLRSGGVVSRVPSLAGLKYDADR